MRRRAAFTLLELLLVLAIIAIVSAAVIPSILPAIQHRQVSESARIIQAALEGSRDLAIRTGRPAGIRLLPDPTYPGSSSAANVPLAFNRIVPIEPAGEYAEGLVSIRTGALPDFGGRPALRIEEAQVDRDGLRQARTSWYWSIRVGDRMRIGGSGAFYTVCGPQVTASPEGFVNVGPPGTTPANPNEAGSEYLFLVNGQDDDGDGFADEGADGIDQDAPPNGVDDAGEWETEAWLGQQAMLPTVAVPYTIRRRPYPTPGGRVVELPSGVVVDGSSWDSTRERSRLPIDPGTMTVDIMIGSDGQVVPTTIYSTPAAAEWSLASAPFMHLFLSERADVFEPVTGTTAGARRLPVPEGTAGLAAGETRFLTGERRLITVHMRTGMVTTTDPQAFDATGAAGSLDVPFADAQMGRRDQ